MMDCTLTRPRMVRLLQVLLACWCITALVAQPVDPAEPTQMTLKTFSWDGATTLTICADKPLVDEPATGPSPNIVYTDGGIEINIDGTLNSDDKCADFESDTNPFSTTPLQYNLVVKNGTETKTGNATFSVKLQQSIINCGGSDMNRISFNGKSPSIDKAVTCGDSADGLSGSCYVDAADVATFNLCYSPGDSKPADISVCQTGLFSDETLAPITVDPSFTINSLNYGEPATLEFNFADPTDVISYEVMVKKSEEQDFGLVLFGTDSSCIVDGFDRSSDSYEVCAVSKGADNIVLTAGSGTITDIDLSRFLNGKLLEFGFVNNNPLGMYTVMASNTTTEFYNSVTLDCSGVEQGNSCFGFIDVTGSLVGNLAVSYEGGTNTVAADYDATPPDGGLAIKNGNE